MQDTRDIYAGHWRRLEDTILRHAGMLDVSVRQSLAIGQQIPEPLAAYVEKVAHYAFRVTDNDVRALRAAGYSDDQIFEATLSIALGAAQRRLRAGLDALRAASGISETPASVEPDGEGEEG
jgi:alkylhydroperoxidase family enzyme